MGLAGCAAPTEAQRQLEPLAPLVAPVATHDGDLVAASQPVLPDGIDEATVEGLCGGWCDKEAYVATSHAELGLGRFVWLFSPIGGAVGPVFVVDGEVRWSLPVADPTAHARRASVDVLGHVFFQVELGDGREEVVVLVPTEHGFTDLRTLGPSSPWRAAGAAYGDIGGGEVVVLVDDGDGPVVYRWDGNDYAVVDLVSEAG